MPEYINHTVHSWWEYQPVCNYREDPHDMELLEEIKQESIQGEG